MSTTLHRCLRARRALLAVSASGAVSLLVWQGALGPVVAVVLLALMVVLAGALRFVMKEPAEVSEVVQAPAPLVMVPDVDHVDAVAHADQVDLEEVLAAVADGVVIVSPDGVIESWNAAMERITGRSADEAIGEDASTFIAAHPIPIPGDRRSPDSPLRASNLLADGAEVELLHCDGSPRCVRVRVRGNLLVVSDFTVEHAASAVGNDFLMTVSHELRTPLTPLRGALSMLHSDELELEPAQITALHASMAKQADRLHRLIEDVIEVAELRGARELHADPVDLASCVTTAIASQVTDLDRPRIVVDSVATVALGESPAVVRVVRALLANAMVHTTGEVVVRVAAEAGYATVSVRDHGAGIPARDRERVFMNFGRLGNPLLRPQGPGLGLPIARSLARAMRGDVEMRDPGGVGTEFVLRLPLASNVVSFSDRRVSA